MYSVFFFFCVCFCIEPAARPVCKSLSIFISLFIVVVVVGIIVCETGPGGWGQLSRLSVTTMCNGYPSYCLPQVSPPSVSNNKIKRAISKKKTIPTSDKVDKLAQTDITRRNLPHAGEADRKFDSAKPVSARAGSLDAWKGAGKPSETPPQSYYIMWGTGNGYTRAETSLQSIIFYFYPFLVDVKMWSSYRVGGWQSDKTVVLLELYWTLLP